MVKESVKAALLSLLVALIVIPAALSMPRAIDSRGSGVPEEYDRCGSNTYPYYFYPQDNKLPYVLPGDVCSDGLRSGDGGTGGRIPGRTG